MTATREEQVHEFAAQLDRAVATVCADASPFTVNVAGTKRWYAQVSSDPAALAIGGLHLLDLIVDFKCTISDQHPWMLIERSQFGVRPRKGAEWLVRMEYEHRPSDSVPCSHLHVHAHRDAWTFLMTRDGAGSTRRAVKNRAATLRVPQLSDVHFPLGGPRLRPMLEDFLTMLIQDLGVDHTRDALSTLAAAREQWRLAQTRAIISSSQDLAADVLRELGWTVTPPAGHQQRTTPVKWMSRY